MEFEFDEDQRLLQQSVRETLAKVCGQPEDQLWATYLELGWLEAPPVELAIILEELGYIADPTPSSGTPARSPPRSPAARRRSTVTSSPSASSACLAREL